MTVTNIIDPITEREARAAMTEALTEFKSSVSHFERAWGIVLDALDRGAHIALGYRSESDLIAHEFDGYLNALDVANRRVVVRELSSRGASTRAIAAVTGTSDATAWRDVQAGASHEAPEPTVNTETGEVSDDYLPDDSTGEEVTPSDEAAPTAGDSESETPGEEVEPLPAPSRPAVTGIDGKTYTQREPKRESDEGRRQREHAAAMTDVFSRDIGRALSVLGGYGQWDNPSKVMDEFDEAHLSPPQVGEFYTLDNLRSASRFLDALIAWKESR